MHFRKARWCIPTWTVTGDIQNTHLSHLFIFQRIPRISLQSQFDETCLLGRGSLCNSAGLEAALWREADATWIFLNMGRTCPLSQSKSSKFQNDPTSKIVCLNDLEMILIEHHILFLSVVHLVLWRVQKLSLRRKRTATAPMTCMRAWRPGGQAWGPCHHNKAENASFAYRIRGFLLKIIGITVLGFGFNILSQQIAFGKSIEIAAPIHAQASIERRAPRADLNL